MSVVRTNLFFLPKGFGEQGSQCKTLTVERGGKKKSATIRRAEMNVINDIVIKKLCQTLPPKHLRRKRHIPSRIVTEEERRILTCESRLGNTSIVQTEAAATVITWTNIVTQIVTHAHLIPLVTNYSPMTLRSRMTSSIWLLSNNFNRNRQDVPHIKHFCLLCLNCKKLVYSQHHQQERANTDLPLKTPSPTSSAAANIPTAR